MRLAADYDGLVVRAQQPAKTAEWLRRLTIDELGGVTGCANTRPKRVVRLTDLTTTTFSWATVLRLAHQLDRANAQCAVAEKLCAALRLAGVTEADADQASGLSAAEAEFERAWDARWKAENWLLLHGTPQEQRMVLARRARDELNFTDAELTAAGLGAAA